MCDLLGEQLLQVRLDAVLDQARVDAELVLESCSTSWIVTTRRSLGLGVLHRPDLPDAGGASASVGSPTIRLHGGLIQLSGLYEPPSECTSTEPSALTRSSRAASGRWAVSRPA